MSVLKKMLAAVASGAMVIFGLSATSAAISVPSSGSPDSVRNITASTPIFLTSSQSSDMQYQGHFSHGSHGSHGSHASHVSHYSSRW